MGDISAIDALRPFEPQLCIDLSSSDITLNQEQLHLHFRVFIHAGKSVFGFRPPDVTVFEHQEELGQACAGRPESSCLEQPLCGYCDGRCELGDKHGALCGSNSCSSWQHRDPTSAPAESQTEEVNVDAKQVDTDLQGADRAAKERKAPPTRKRAS